MTPAKAAILNTALAPIWQRLRAWVQAALYQHEHSRDQLAHDEIVPIRTAIFEIEALLRRLVLVAATAVTLDMVARWSPPPKTDAKTRAKQSSKRIVRAAQGFRLFTLRWSKSDRSLTTTVSIDTSGAQHATPRTHAHSDTLTSGPPTCRSSQSAGRPASHLHHRAHISKEPSEMTVEDFMNWRDTHVPTETSAEAAWREMHHQPEPRRAPTGPARPKLEHKAAPVLLDATALQARLALLAELAANPEAFIRRAAIAMARRREIAWRLSRIAAPKARGALAVSAAMLGTIIPFHAGFREALSLFALSYTEPDTT